MCPSASVARGGTTPAAKATSYNLQRREHRNETLDPIRNARRGCDLRSSAAGRGRKSRPGSAGFHGPDQQRNCADRDRKSTRLNSSHQIISYAVFCLKKKKKKTTSPTCT